MTRLIDLRGKLRRFESPEDAAEALALEGQCPAEFTLIWLRERDGGIQPILWPSEADPDTTCRRELLLRRLPQVAPLDLRGTWDRFLGLGIEAGLQAAEAPCRLYQCGIPDGLIEAGLVEEDHPAIVALGEGDDRVLAVDLGQELGNALLRGRMDVLDGDRIEDWKVTGFPGPNRDWGLKDNWVRQLQLYAFALRRLEVATIEDQEIVVWRIYRDPYVWKEQGVGQPKRKMADLGLAFRRFEVPVWDDEKVLSTLGDHLRSCAGLLEKLVELAPQVDGDLESLRGLFAEIPMDGERMFGGKKCSRYCDVRDACFALAGRPEF